MIVFMLYMIFLGANLLFSVYLHGKERSDTKYNFWVDLITIIILTMFAIGILLDI